MTARYIHDGLAIDYRPTVDVNAGDIVTFGTMVGVARLDIKAGELGAFAVTGVYDIKKATGTSHAVGSTVYWDAAGKKASTTTTHPKLGIVVADAMSDDEYVRVRIG